MNAYGHGSDERVEYVRKTPDNNKKKEEQKQQKEKNEEEDKEKNTAFYDERCALGVRSQPRTSGNETEKSFLKISRFLGGAERETRRASRGIH